MQPSLLSISKTYATAMGQKAVDLAQAMERASKDHVRMIAVVLPLTSMQSNKPHHPWKCGVSISTLLDKDRSQAGFNLKTL